jgi:hypothetical protein
MPPEAIVIFNTLFGIILILVTAIVKVLWDAVKTLQKDLNRLEVALPTVYVPKAEYHSDMKDIKMMLEKIVDKLEGKVDKIK